MSKADKYHRALVEIVNILGPNTPHCSANVCEGCQFEMANALKAAKTALHKRSLPRKRDLRKKRN